jgi:putative nucleotidyltransferase with HDIG domain
VFTAVSLVGLSRVREVALQVSLSGFLQKLAPSDAAELFWAHSLACAVCGVELAQWAPVEVNVDSALIAGLLHDVGQLWLHRFEPQRMQQALLLAKSGHQNVEDVERSMFGVDHGAIGGWLAQSWGLPAGIGIAIAQHHTPDAALDEPLVAVVHVGNVLCNALDLAHNPDSRVTSVSHTSCAKLGLTWGPDTQSLFGRIEARSRHAFASLTVVK